MTQKPYDNPVRIVVTLRGKLADLDRDLATIEQGFKGGFNESLNAPI